MSRKRALDYVTNHRVMTLATSGRDGIWAAALFYVNEGFDFYFLSAGHTRHAEHMRQNPRVAATIQEDYAGWREIQGIQLEGAVFLLEGRLRELAQSMYLEKYSFIRRAAGPVRAALAQVNWYHLEPEHLFFVDNSRGFGHRDQIF
jgi:hypothetical protein